ncbi:hypothetical protein ACFWDF_34540 [Streptomyces diastaticus]|uniref:hypothetical protein n=1 Tax=Streptomyces diastaticus TaxID=1956 RepID=UPI0036B0B308
MSRYHTLWAASGRIELWGATDGTLYLEPNGVANDQVVLVPSKDMTPEQMLAVADRVLAGVQRWRDTVAEHVERKRTTADELAAAKAEIQRLRAKQGGAA